MKDSFKRIAEQTEKNLYSKAISMGLELLTCMTREERRGKQDSLLRIEAEYTKKSYLSPTSNKERRDIYKYMIKKAKEQMTEKEFAEFHSCF